jgi:hypothetical protein
MDYTTQGDFAELKFPKIPFGIPVSGTNKSVPITGSVEASGLLGLKEGQRLPISITGELTGITELLEFRGNFYMTQKNQYVSPEVGP